MREDRVEGVVVGGGRGFAGGTGGMGRVGGRGRGCGRGDRAGGRFSYGRSSDIVLLVLGVREECA